MLNWKRAVSLTAAIIKALLCSQPLVDIIKDTNSNNGYVHIEKGDNTTFLTDTIMFIEMVGHQRQQQLEDVLSYYLVFRRHMHDSIVFII